MAITVIEDRDPIIVYTGQWTPSGNRFESDGTTMVTEEVGASFTIEFVGRNISVFGTIPVLAPGQSPTTAVFTLDDGTALPPTTFTAQHHPNQTQYYIPMFRSPHLTEDRAHKLVVQHQSGRAGQLTLDYVTVQGRLERYALPGQAGAGTVGGVGGASSGGGGLSETAKMAIVGGVLGGVILVLMGLVAALLMKQRKSSQGSVFTTDSKAALSPEHSGFLGYHNHNQSPMNTGSQAGTHVGTDAHGRSLTMSPAMTVQTQAGYPPMHTPYRPPLPEMHES